MREIKFRAWDERTNTMTICRTLLEWFNAYAQFEWDTKNVQHERISQFEFMQYTGLKDKNGKEIYEGDIVNLKGRKYIVEYWKGQLLVSWYLKSVRSGDTEYTELPVIGKGEVIGNIYENPELLEVENENNLY